MPFDFPPNPTEGQRFTPPGGPTYEWRTPRWLMMSALLPDAPLDGSLYGRKDAAWEPVPPTRIKLTTYPNFYVRTDGNDANDGSANTADKAFKTIQRAVNLLLTSYDLNGLGAYIQVADGTYPEAVLVTGPWVGAGEVYVQGNSSTPANVQINATGNGFTVRDGGRLTLQGLSIGSTSSGVSAEKNGRIRVWNPMEFRACSWSAIDAKDQGEVEINGFAIAIKGGGQAVFTTSKQGLISASGCTLAFSNSPNFTTAIAYMKEQGLLLTTGMTATGTFTGAKFSCETAGGITTGGALNPEMFPGSTPGRLYGTGFFDNRSGLLERLSANRTYYIRLDGDDNNDGMANLATRAFRTVTRAVRAAYNLDFNGYNVTIQFPSGSTINEAVIVSGTLRTNGANGHGALIFQGSTLNVSDAANYKWTAAGRTLSVQGGARAYLAGIEMSSTVDTTIVVSDFGSQLDLGNYCRFGASTGYQLWAYGGGRIQVRTPYSIVGAAGAHIAAHNGGQIDINGVTVTITGTPTMTYFAAAAQDGFMQLVSMTFTGGITGTRFLVASGAGIFVNGAGVNYLPGTIAGVTTAPGWYV